MRYKIRQRIFSLASSFTIKDEFDSDVYNVNGRLFTIGNKLTISDIAGIERVYIEQIPFRLLAEYNIYADNQLKAKVKKQFTFFNSKFDIEASDGSYTIEGNILAHEFRILKDNIVIATISKEFFSLSDTYGIDIASSEDDVFILALAIVVDMVCHHNKK